MNLFTLILLQLCCTIESQKNIALNGSASQSSVYKWDNYGYPKDMTADLAIIGPPTNDLDSKSCALTDSKHNIAWWMLTFPINTVFVTTITIFPRNAALFRFALHSLYISNTSISTQNPGRPPEADLCYQDVGPNLPSINQSHDCYALGKNIIIYNNRTNGTVLYKDPGAFLELCDVQVYGCYKGWSGNDCLIPCPVGCIERHCFPNNGTCVWGCLADNCLHDKCHFDTGVCFEGCKPGLAGRFCNKSCKNGSYGYNCNETCPGCVSNQCDILDGNCSIKGICNPGWVGPKCNEPCEFGFFGEDCALVCHCINQTCNHTSGLCPSGGCKRGYIGFSCSTTCKNGSYGYNCNETCSGCVSNQCDKIDGNCSITGRCYPEWVGPKCNEPCKLGFFGEDCAEVCHCLNQTCNHISGLCPSGGCKRGYMGDSCSTVHQAEDYFKIAGFIGGGIIAAVLLVTIAILIQRRRNKNVKLQTTMGLYENQAFSVNNIETNYEENIAVSQEHQYDVTGYSQNLPVSDELLYEVIGLSSD